jgi:hypothetical protein
MGQVLLTHNMIEPARDPFTVSLSDIVRGQVQPVCKRRKLAQTSEDCEQVTTTTLEKNYLYDDVGYSIIQGIFFCNYRWVSIFQLSSYD